VLLSLVLITIYFREPAGGGLHSIQSGGATVLRPFEVGAERIARPFRDAYGYFAGLIHAKSQNAELRAQVDKLTQLAIQNSTATDEANDLRRQLNYISSPRFPKGYDQVTTSVISRPPGEFQQQIGIAAGYTSGIRSNDPVVTADGLVGLVTQVAHDSAEVTLLTDPNLRVAALDRDSGAAGMLSHGSGRGTLTLGRVLKSQMLTEGDTIVTQGFKLRDLTSLYPEGILIGYVSGASQSEIDLYWQAQVSPSVHFDALRSVIVLVKKKRTSP
jgi:Cell shape-determining protein